MTKRTLWLVLLVGLLSVVAVSSAWATESIGTRPPVATTATAELHGE